MKPLRFLCRLIGRHTWKRYPPTDFLPWDTGHYRCWRCGASETVANRAMREQQGR